MNVLMNDGTEFKSPSAIRDGVKGGARKGEPMDDLISRQQAIDAIMGEYPDVHYPDWYASKIRALPSAQPYTAEEIDKMQELESAQLEKAYELGRESAQPEKRTDKRTEIHACDLISRQAAIDAVNNAFDRETLLTGFVRSIAVRAIRDMPSAQPEIIRCKDCKHYHTDVWGQELGIEGLYGHIIVAHNACDKWTKDMNCVTPDGFCFLAERRTDETD